MVNQVPSGVYLATIAGTVFQAIVAVLASKMKDDGKWKAFVEGNRIPQRFCRVCSTCDPSPLPKTKYTTNTIFFIKSRSESLFTSQSHESLELAIIIEANVVGEQVHDVVKVAGKLS